MFIATTAVSEIGVRARLCAKKFKNAKIHEVHTNPQASLPDTCILYVGPLLVTSEPYSRGVGEIWCDMRLTAGLIIQDTLQNICIERALGLG